MRITLLQTDIFWEDKSANLDILGMHIGKLSGTTDLVVLPEMFTTGFSMRSRDLAETMQGPSAAWMKNIASHYNLAVCGSIIVKEGQKHLNRFLFATPDGSMYKYDKRHLFGPGGEDRNFNAGKERVVISYGGLRIMPCICYDLRFPVWLRNRNDYDLLVCVANWPESRREVWNILLKTRAIENQCFVAGVNRIGNDPEGNHYAGESAVIDPKGKIMINLTEADAGHITAELDIQQSREFRTKFPVWKDSDEFNLIV